MAYMKRLVGVVSITLLVFSLSMAQGPKKDIGKKVPLPPVEEEQKKDQDKKDQEKKPEEKFALSIDVNLVNLDVVVTDKNNNPIGGLQKEHFKVYEDNVPQTITNFSPADAPLTVVVLVEFSDTFGYYFDDVVQPAAGFINSLRPDDWGALVAFDIRPEILVDFTKNKNALYGGLSRLRIPAYRETSLYDAVYDTLERLENVDGKKAIFLLSTGLDTISKHSYPETLKKAESSDTMIYAIGMGQLARELLEARGYFGSETNIEFLQADNVLRSLCDATGGVASFPRFAGQYPGIYETVGAHLRYQYSLGFVSTNRKADGKFRKLRVEVPPIDVNHNGKLDKLKVRNKKGYYGPKT